MSGLYLHIPFCRKACHYCDFHFSTSLQNMEEMVEALCREMELRAHAWRDKDLKTIYFGGGTPSILSPGQMEKIFDKIHQLFSLSGLEECTLEANPDDMEEEKLKLWKSAGINRLSIGLQTFDDQKLLWMNRIHNAKEGIESVKAAQDAGFENISLDLMYHFPDTGIELLEKDIAQITGLAPQHISAYGLTLEPNTAFGKWHKKGKIKPMSDELAATQFQFLISGLEEKGYFQYEISNFSKAGFEAKHNSAYWFQKPYLGIGPGAHGFDGENLRYENLPNNPLYIRHILKENKLFQKEERLNPEDQLNEAILTRLRTKWGLDLAEWERRTGISLKKEKEKKIDHFIDQGLLTQKDEMLFLTSEGKLLADYITAELMV